MSEKYTQQKIDEAILWHMKHVTVYQGYLCDKHNLKYYECKECEDFTRRDKPQTLEQAKAEVKYRIAHDIQLTHYNQNYNGIGE